MFQGDHSIEKQHIAAHQKPMEPVFIKDAKKSASFPCATEQESALVAGGSVVMPTLAIGRIQNGLDDAKRHSGPQNTECIPQPTHKDYVGHIPHPLEIEWKHCVASLQPVYASAGVNPGSGPSSVVSAVSAAAAISASGSRGFNSASWGKMGR